MKKMILLSASMLSSILILVSFSVKKKSVVFEAPPANNIINCAAVAVAPTLMTAEAFKAKYEPDAVIKIRKNVDALTQAEINALKVGIIKMKSLPYTNPTSWAYQANIHGTTMPDNLPSWNSCHKADQAFFFLAWHRMYVYFFERILRAKSGRANLTLPYWNYQINPVLHPAYRDNNPANPLYDITRTAAINAGGALPASISTAFNTSLGIIAYYTMQNNMNNGPHGSVHSSIAGNMAIVPTAAQDPVFWLHHSNIDRLWEEWLSKCGGRANPTDAAFLTNAYTFFDEFGNPVSMTGSQILQVTAQLSYKYDVLPSDPTCGSGATALLSRQALLTEMPASDVTDTSEATFDESSAGPLDSFVTATKKTDFDFKNTVLPERLTLTFKGLTISKMPEGVIEIYLNAPKFTRPVSSSIYFVGLLDLFSGQHQAMLDSMGMQDKDEIEVDASSTAQALGLKLRDLRRARISFVVRGITLNGREVRTTARVKIRNIKFALDRFRVRQ